MAPSPSPTSRPGRSPLLALDASGRSAEAQRCRSLRPLRTPADCRSALEAFLAAVDRPRGIHLCGNPDWGFLFCLDLDIASLDVFTNGEVVAAHHRQISAFLDRGGPIVWGIVPTGFETFDTVTAESLASRLRDLWRELLSHGLDRELLLDRSLLSPATCCLVNPDGARTVEAAFAATSELARHLRSGHAT